ncbi:trehalose-phosphatase [Mycobacterium sp. CBMA293]|uniref:trehalose-phosphatase n=2 Tax=Mycolicibacterium TaxID=1866885 RepID=UPI00132657ED|nr:MULTISPECIES: trehalose-phosphatase [unclassified Mycolicibacterium]MUL46181.1 trehalose-phosphatase [Mycolicibacterium sp. CBMA 360]MUL94128.1 trehalose-phosphatase [Mycolicibacterium sp. CBMA 230]MUL58770.1 trehalose-phosphatase [Mycolicibacterium sp. CBMA 335]MUL69164.1 trehalose-phosphatase [Mycolicibacterium sp. CBMA 311]MUM05140.1 trehalose-phosphatase [Mycolicibacterium sp. CBMA 213]
MLPVDLVTALDAVAATPRLLVTSDFDGTLSPIVNNPADARALPAGSAALLDLVELPHTSVALVSGRALEVLRELSGMPESVHLVGSHGAEFNTGFTQPVDGVLLARITDSLTEIAHQYPGVAVETKPASVALHVRNASEADGMAALTAARLAGTEWDAETTEGKAVLEFAVVATNKGSAIDVLRERDDATAVVFLGDDVTDEKAFARLRDGDVGVKVGPGPSAAQYRVDSPEDVAEVLAYLAGRRAG